MRKDLFEEIASRERWVRAYRFITVAGLAGVVGLLVFIAQKLNEASLALSTLSAISTGVANIDSKLDHMKANLAFITVNMPPKTAHLQALTFGTTTSFQPGSDTKCQSGSSKFDCSAEGWNWSTIHKHDEGKLKELLGAQGTVLVVINAGHDDQQLSLITSKEHKSNFNLAFRRGVLLKAQLGPHFERLIEAPLVAHVEWIVVPQGAAQGVSRERSRSPSFSVLAIH